MQDLPASISEDRGIALLTPGDLRVYSIGISTAGLGEVRMARLAQDRVVVATTIDELGAEFTRKYVRASDVEDRVLVRIEDAREPFPHEDGSFDFVYSRLALHYLQLPDLGRALSEVKRVLRPSGKFFAVVQGLSNVETDPRVVDYDDVTGELTYRMADGSTRKQTRRLHTIDSMTGAIREAGFDVVSSTEYDEVVYSDYERTQNPFERRLIEVVAKGF